MGIFKHTKSGKRFLFIHIPRTAGRFIENTLLAQGWEYEVPQNITLTRLETLNVPGGMYDSVEGIEIAHFHKELYEKYLDVENIPHVSIIRDPIDRFISASRFLTRYYKTFFNMNDKEIQEYVENEFESSLTVQQNDPRFPESVNWYRTQTDFLSNKTKVWKFEDGINDEFFKWISNVVGVNIKSNPNTAGWSDHPSAPLKKTEKIVRCVKNFYKKDIMMEKTHQLA
jgi:hypothetical protein